MSDATAEAEPRDTGGGDDAARSVQPEGMGSVVEVPPGAATLGQDGPLLRVHPDPSHGREVDDETIIDGAESGHVVASTADGEGQAVIAGKVDGSDDVRHVPAARDQPWVAVDHAVEDLACFFVFRVAGVNKFAAQAQPELFDVGYRECLVACLYHGFVLLRRCYAQHRDCRSSRDWSHEQPPPAAGRQRARRTEDLSQANAHRVRRFSATAYCWGTRSRGRGPPSRGR